MTPTSDGPAPRREAVHLLRLPGDVAPAAVLDLVDQRYPAAEPVVVQGLAGRRLGRHAVLADPVWPGDGTQVWEARLLRERGDPPWPGATDPDGLYRVFADGMPMRSEQRVVGLLLALARRLGGDLVLDTEAPGGPRHLVVDPEACIDVTVLSPHWLEPARLLAVLTPGEPGVRLAVEGAAWDGPAVGEDGTPSTAKLAGVGVDEVLGRIQRDRLVALHAVADATDAAALAAPDVLDAYEARVEIDRAGTVVVQAHAAEEVPARVARLEWPLVVAVDVRWWAPDPAQAQREAPSGEFRGARRRARVRLRGVALALAEAGEGVVVDADGLEIDRYQL